MLLEYYTQLKFVISILEYKSPEVLKVLMWLVRFDRDYHTLNKLLLDLANSHYWLAWYIVSMNEWTYV